jgi:hypothetical protein
LPITFRMEIPLCNSLRGAGVLGSPEFEELWT